MNEYWQNLARELITTADQPGLYESTDTEAMIKMAKWIGRAQAALEEALRVSETGAL